MWIVLVGGLMITLPATMVILFSFGRISLWPALASFTINMLPFLVAFLIMRRSGKHGGGDLDH